MSDYLMEIFDMTIPYLMDLIFEGKLPTNELTKPLEQLIERTPLNLTTQLANYL